MARRDALMRITKSLLSRRAELRKRLGMELDTIHQVCEQRRAQHVADIGMVVAQAGEPLAAVEVKVTAAAGAVQIRTSRRSAVSSIMCRSWLTMMTAPSYPLSA